MVMSLMVVTAMMMMMTTGQITFGIFLTVIVIVTMTAIKTTVMNLWSQAHGITVV